MENIREYQQLLRDISLPPSSWAIRITNAQLGKNTFKLSLA